MSGEWLTMLESASLVRALRYSTWAYPLVNACHVLGIALLVGAVLSLDLRLLGAWRNAPLAPLWHVLTRVAATGLLIAAVCGVLLFATRATEYAQSPLFLTKLLVVAVGVFNAVSLRFAGPLGLRALPAPSEPTPLRLKIAALVSGAAWMSALTLGRLIGYF